ncbi:unnamed protein product [Rhizoctonia solani]|uniref:NACHT domain-containing protein n=1 Tax=Rhizoctonia solani TaxID=456999 RepID=A0A8H3DLN0_9AGAM|nr:unnamed protein product [Rhizoctonia solani]
MPPKDRHPNSKKGFLSPVRNFFRRSSSNPSPPVTLPHPAPHKSSSRAEVEIHRPDEASREAELAQSSEEPSVVLQPVSASGAISAAPEPNNPQPELPPADTPAALDPVETTPAITNPIWAGLKTTLQGLRDNSGVFSHLSLAAGILLECFDGVETAARNREDYDDLGQELAALSGSLAELVKAPTPLTKSISSVEIEIKLQTKEIKDRMTRGPTGRFLAAKEDEDDILRRYQRIQSLFRQLQANLSVSAWSITNEHLVNTRLEGLHPVKQATYDSTLSSVVNRRMCTEGTRERVLSDLDEWVDAIEKPAVYWMNGMAGTGKTTIACTFSGRLEGKEKLAASFFCTRTTADCRDVSRIIPTIAYQLARYSIPFQSALYEILGKEPDAGSKNTQKQFERLLRDPLQKVKDAMPDNLVVVIDALDECDDHGGVEEMLDILFQYAPAIPLKILVTSRPEPEIHKRMTAYSQSHSAVHLHDIESSLVQADISLYLKEGLASLSVSPTQISQLVDQSGSLFIYAATLVRYIKSGSNPKSRLASVLSMTPEATRRHAQIDALYTAVLTYKTGHLALASKTDTLLKMLEEFLSERLLFWAEVLSLKRDVPTGVETLLKAKRWLNKTGPTASELVVLLEDARNFVTGFASSPASQSTPHIYISCLPFCPRSSSVYKNYWKRTRGLLQLEGSLMGRREGAALATWNVGSDVNSVAWSPDGTKVAVGCGDHTVRILNAHNGMPLFEPLKGHTDDVLSVAFSPDGKLVASGSADRTIRVWNAHNGTPVSDPFEGHTDYVVSVSFSPDGMYIVSGSSDGTIRIWNASDGTLFKGPLEGHTSFVNSVAFSPDGTLIASASYDCTVRLWNLQDGTPVASPFQGHTHYVYSVAFTPDGTRLVSGSGDYTICMWNISDGSLVTSPFRGHTNQVLSVAVSPDGTRVASSSSDRTVRVWSIDDGTLAAGPFVGHTERIYSVAYSTDGTRVISGSYDRTVRVWNVRDGLSIPFAPFENHITQLTSVSLPGSGTRILSNSDDRTIWAWDISHGQVVASPLPVEQAIHLNTVHSLPTGSHIAFSTPDCRLQVMDLTTDSLLADTLPGHTGSITSSVYSADGSLLVTGSADRTIRIWDLQRAILAAGPFRGHHGKVTSVGISPDSLRVVSCSGAYEDKTIRIWNVANALRNIAPLHNPSTDPSSTHSQTHAFEGWGLQDDGWVTNSSSELLFWIPLDLATIHAWPSPHAEFIITKDGVLHILQQELRLGDQWSRCYVSD